MQTTNVLKKIWICGALLLAGFTVAQAQTTATWIGPSSGGEWNTGANWNTGLAPADSTTNAIIGIGTNVSYNTPMTAASFGNLTNFGILAVNAGGFNCSGVILPRPQVGAIFYLTNGAGAVTVAGDFNMFSNASATMIAGTSLTITGSGRLRVGSSTSSSAAGASTFTNSGGTLNANTTAVGQPSGTGTGKLVISGGVNNLGNTTFGRYAAASASTLGATEGLNIFGGVVTMSNLTGSAASFGSTYISGGTVTNFGNVTLNGTTATRYLRVVQAGGLFVVPDPGVIYLNPATAGGETARYQVTGGTNIISGIIFGNTNTSAAALAATATMTVGGSVYVGSQGIALGFITNTTSIALSSGGIFGATTDWKGSVPMTLGSGTPPFAFQAADVDGTPHNITLSNLLAGSGGLNKTGGGTLLLGATNTYSGVTLVNGGTLALDVNGSVTKSTKIIVGSGTTFDVSAVNGGFVLTNQTLSGSGGVVTGAVLVASGATIDPGSNTITGTLSFSNSVTETNGGVVNHFDLAGAPNPNNDLAIIAGDLNVGGTNTVDITGVSLVAGTNYVIFQYGGNFNGDITNFALSLSSPVGILTNDTVAKTISFSPQTVLRGPTNIVWIGNPVNTNWDNATTTNWLNASSSVLDIFVSSDSVQFTDAGASNSPVNIVGAVQPASILVNSQSNYVFASTSGGWIGGTASLIVTNTGTLTIAIPTNTYTGNTTIDGSSTLFVSQLANAGSPSAIGQGNLIINNGTLNYTGSSSSVSLGATLGSASSTISLASGTLTLGGALTGSGTLNKIGNGQLTLSGANNYAGGTVINAGTIRGNPATALGTNTLTLNGFTNSSMANFRFDADAQTLSATLNVVGTNNSITTGGNETVGTITGSGTLNCEGTGANIITFQAADMTAFTGTIYWDTITTNRFFPSSGTSINAPSTTFDMGGGSGVLMNRDGGNYHIGALQSSSSSTQVRGSNNSGSANTTYYIGEKGIDTTFAGNIRTGTGGTGATTTIVKLGADTFTLTGNNTYTGSTTISNGVLALSGSGSIANSSIINIVSGAFLDVSGRGDVALTLGSGQQLRGNGTIRGILSGGSGIVSPGGGPSGGIGTLTVTNTINLNGTTWMKVNRNGGSPINDQLVSSLAAVNYGGTLLVTNIGSTLQANDTFTLFNGTSYSGSFSSIQPASASWDTSQLNVNGSIKFLRYLTPAISSVDFSDLSNGNITIYSTNGPPNGSVNFLVSTNIALPVSQWTTVDSTALFPDGSLGPFGYTIVVDQTKPQLFIILQQQQ